MAEPNLIECTAEPIRARAVEEIVIDVRRNGPTLTAEACCASQTGVNLCLHDTSDKDPQKLVSELIEGVEKLGISTARYRVVREDLPPQIQVEYRHAS